MKKLIGIFLFLIALQTKGHSESTGAFKPDDKIIKTIRQVLSVPVPWQISISSIEPSILSNIDKGVIHFQLGENVREQFIFISSDGNHFLLGNIFDANIDYDALRVSRINFGNAVSKGEKNAPVTIVEYSDPQCPACKQVEQRIPIDKILSDYKGKVRWITKHIPIALSHTWAMQASVSCLCAAEQKPDAFWAMQTFFFDQQTQITTENLKEKTLQAVKDLNLNLKKFESCSASSKMTDIIKANIQESEKINIQLTPSFVINGRIINGGTNEQEIKTLIDYFLK